MTERKDAAMFGPPLDVQRDVLRELGLPDDVTDRPERHDAADDPYWDKWGFDAEDVARVINEACARAQRSRADEGSTNEDISDDR